MKLENALIEIIKARAYRRFLGLAATVADGMTVPDEVVEACERWSAADPKSMVRFAEVLREEADAVYAPVIELVTKLAAEVGATVEVNQ